MESLGLNQQVLPEIISWSHDIFTAEASIILHLHLALHKDVESFELKPVELHLVELEGILLQKSQDPTS